MWTKSKELTKEITKEINSLKVEQKMTGEKRTNKLLSQYKKN